MLSKLSLSLSILPIQVRIRVNEVLDVRVGAIYGKVGRKERERVGVRAKMLQYRAEGVTQLVVVSNSMAGINTAIQNHR